MYYDDEDEPNELNIDDLNDETFGGDDDIGDWEKEHEKLAGFLNDDHDKRHKNDAFFGSSNHNEYTYHQRDFDDEIEDFVRNSISKLGLEDDDEEEEFDDPAIMSIKKQPRASHFSNHLFRQRSPPPALLNLDTISQSPTTNSIWSTSGSDFPPPPSTPPKPLLPLIQTDEPKPKMLTVEELEKEMISKEVMKDRIAKIQELQQQRLLRERQEKSLHREQERLLQHEQEKLLQHKGKLIHEQEKLLQDKLIHDQQQRQQEKLILLQRRHHLLQQLALQQMNQVNRPPNHVVHPNHPVFQFQSNPLFHPIPRPSPNIPPLSPAQRLQMRQFQLQQQLLQYNQRFFPIQQKNINMNLVRNLSQLNRNYNEFSGIRNYGNNNGEDEDEYAGLMTQRDKERIAKIHQLSVEQKDPYVDDYYYVIYTSQKILAASDEKGEKAPSLLLPERPKNNNESANLNTNNYVPIQFERSLGKIQVSNVNCPRKLLECKVNKQTSPDPMAINDNLLIENKISSKSEIRKFRRNLLQIERLYVVLLSIDDEDKRIGALPSDARQSHIEMRLNLCEKIYNGLMDNDKIRFEIVSIKKGLLLLFRSLMYISIGQRANIIKELLHCTNFRQFVVKSKDRIDYGKIIINAIKTIDKSELLLHIVSGINDISMFVKSEVSEIN